MAESHEIRVLVVDDHDLLREGVTSVLASFADIDVVGEADSGEGAVESVESLAPDVVVMDLVMPGIGGLEAIRRIRKAWPSVAVVALSSFSDGAQVKGAIEAGASGYLIKSVDAASLASAVRDAAGGKSTFSPDATLALVSSPPSKALSSLTAREAEIAGLVAHGRTNAEIAEALSLSIFTVKNYVSSILMKLDVRTRTEAAALLLTHD